MTFTVDIWDQKYVSDYRDINRLVVIIKLK